MSGSIVAKYETRKASNQTIADIFEGSWKTQLPGDIRSGLDNFFETDFRPRWLDQQIPGGLAGKAVLEFGPFEGYQTYWLDKLGAFPLVSVEGNTINFLKCLCLKEMIGLKASFRHGDIMEELRDPGRKYDVIWASGVLYHMSDPVGFIEQSCKASDYVYIWTTYYDEARMETIPAGTKPIFLPQFDKEQSVGGKIVKLYARTYAISTDYEQNIPLYWEGAPTDLTMWMTLPDIYHVFSSNGFEIGAVEFLGETNGIPIASFMARRAG